MCSEHSPVVRKAQLIAPALGLCSSYSFKINPAIFSPLTSPSLEGGPPPIGPTNSPCIPTSSSPSDSNKLLYGPASHPTSPACPYLKMSY